jgi:hypothetical protein
MQILSYSILLSILFFLAGCKKVSTLYKENSSNSDSVFGIKEIESDELDFVQDKDALLIDCRDEVYYKFSHLDRSVNVTINMIQHNPSEVMMILKKKNYSRIVVYCYSKSCDKSTYIARHLVYTGAKVEVYADGWEVLNNFSNRPGESPSNIMDVQ